MKGQSLIEICFQGLNQEKIFNKLNNMGVEMFDIKRNTHKQTSFKVHIANYKIVEKILLENNIKIENTKYHGFHKMLYSIVARIGILIGFLLCLAFITLANNFILKIEIIGNSKIETSEILSYLKANNISQFSCKELILNDELEHNLISDFDKISMVSVVVKGSSLIINIKEKIGAEEPTNFKDIVADFNGRLTEINLISGTLNKKVGDLIKKGDTLVSAFCYDSLNNKLPVKANAKIRAEIWLESEYTHYDKQIITKLTGKEIKQKDISIFGVMLFKENKNLEFENYETSVVEKKFINTLLPIKVKYYTFKEVVTEEINQTFEEHKTEILNKCKENALQQTNENDIILNEKFNIYSPEPELGITHVNYLVIAERKIY